MDNVVDEIKVELTGEDKSASKTVDEAIQRLKSVADKNRSLWTDISKTSDSALSRIRKAVAPAANAVKGKLAGVGLAGVAAFNNIKYSAENNVGAVGRTISRIKSIVSPTANYIKNTFGQAFSAVSRIPATLGKAASSGFGIAKASVTGFRKAANLIGPVLNKIYSGLKLIGSAGKKVGGVMAKPFTALGKAAGGAVGKLGGLLSSFTRILKYRVIRGIIKGITNAFKEGTGNLYQYSKAVNGTFAQSMDKLSTSALYVKNSLGAIAAPIINAVAPAVEFLTDKFVNLINTVNETIASLTGAKTWTKAIKYPVEFAAANDDASKKTAKAAKKIKRSLLSIDEIHALSDNSDKGSSGNGSKKTDSKDYSKMFKQVATKTNSLIKKIKSAFKKGNYKDIGKFFASGINNALGRINWKNIQNTCKKIAEKTCGFINGFVGKFNWKLLGSTIGEAINTITVTLRTFEVKVNWNKIGKSIAESFNSTIKTIKWKTLGRTLSDLINIPIHFAENFVYTFNWNRFGRSLTNTFTSFVKSIDLLSAARALSGLIKGTATSAQKIFNCPSWGLLGEKLRNALITFFKGNPLSKVADTVRSALGALMDSAIKLFNGGEVASRFGTDVGKALQRWFKDGKWWEKAGMVLSSIAKSVCKFFTNLFKEIRYEDIQNAVARMLSKIDWVGIGKGCAEMIWSGINSGLFTFGLTPGKGVINQDALSKFFSKRLPISYYQKEPNNKVVKITTHAAGGFPEVGQAFIARENGPELVGTIGRKNAVVNNEQIVASVSKGVANANNSQNALLRETNRLLRLILAKDDPGGASVNTSDVIAAFQRKSRRDGKTIVPLGT